jgi:hypothetical protein
LQEQKIGKNDPCTCGSGKKYRQCCWLRRFDGAVSGPALLGDGASTRSNSTATRPAPTPKPKIRVSIGYRFSDGIGTGEVGYSFEVNQQFLLTNGLIVATDRVEVGMQFFLEDGMVATVFRVEQPRECPPPPAGKDAHGNSLKRVVGTVKYSGNYPIMDLVVGDRHIETTPGHRFYSVDRGSWVDAETLVIGERVETKNHVPTPVTHVSPPRFQYIDLYNVEVEDFHTYFVGRPGETSVWTHNGLEGGCAIPKPAQRQRQIPESDGYWSTSPAKGAPKNGVPGESYWHSTDPVVVGHPEYQPIKFSNRYPEFDPFSRVSVEAELTGKPGSGDHKAAAKALARRLMDEPGLAEQLGIPLEAYTRGTSAVKPNATGVLNWMKTQANGGLTWHHSPDMKTIMMVPTDIHAIPHSGGADLLRQAAGIKLKPERWR